MVTMAKTKKAASKEAVTVKPKLAKKVVKKVAKKTAGKSVKFLSKAKVVDEVVEVGPTEKHYKLVIVESPSKAKTIKKYLGRNYQVIACNGHIKDLPKSKLGVDVKKSFEMDLVPITGKKNILDRIENYARSADEIYLASDPDREGEAIAFHLAEEIQANYPKAKKKIYRVLFNAITKNSVNEAISNPTELDEKKYDSQKTRRILDRLVGYKISPILWDKVQRGLSAGRVQSVALRIIVEKEDEIKVFKSEQWFSLHANFQEKGISFEALYYGEELKKKLELLDQGTVDKILKDLNKNGKPVFNVIDVLRRERKVSPTPPFTTSKLQQEAVNKLGFTTKKAMMVAQRLYEGVDISGHGTTGLITYMRTDSVRTEPEALNHLRKHIAERFGKDFLSNEPIIYKKKGSGTKVQDAHESIRPTQLEFAPAIIKKDLSDDEYRLYTLIYNKFVASQMAPSVIDQTSVSLENSGHIFKANGSIEKFPGFRAIYRDTYGEKVSKRGGDDEAENQDTPDVGDKTLPELEVKQKLTAKETVASEEHWTSPPPRYNEASLVKELEEKGIGRPSTYAAIISNITDKGYVEKIENRLRPTELGSVVVKMLIQSFPIEMDVAFTARVEEQLDQIEEGEVKWTKVLKDFWGPFELTLEKAKEEMKNLKKTEIPTGLKCSKCGTGEMMVRWGKNGQFLACSNYPTCNRTDDFTKSLDGVYQLVGKDYFNEPCPTCNKRLEVKKGKFGKFLRCEDYPGCSTTLPFTTGIVCPSCNKAKLSERQSRYGKPFYGCASYPECNFAMWNPPQQHKCTSCGCEVMGLKITKRLGNYLECPKCKAKESIDETA